MYYKVRQLLAQSGSEFLDHKVAQILLQSGAAIAKWGRS